MNRRRRHEGFTLLEVVIAVSILAIGAFMLSLAIATANQMNTLARERSIANNAVRAYIERIKATYPAKGSADMSGFLGLIETGAGRGPASPLFDLDRYYAANGAGQDRFALKSSMARVSVCVGETTTTNWGPVFSSNSAVAALSSAMAPADITACGLPRDLDGDGAATKISGTTGAATEMSNSAITQIPIKIELFWIAGAGFDSTRSNTVLANYQSLTVYAIISAQH